jgi:hypothetical protein
MTKEEWLAVLTITSSPPVRKGDVHIWTKAGTRCGVQRTYGVWTANKTVADCPACLALDALPWWKRATFKRAMRQQA